MEKQIKMRSCVACREIKNKAEFLRAVKTPEGEFMIDKTGKANGRGAYICKLEKCAIEAKKRRKFDVAFKSKVPAEFYDEVISAVKSLNNE